MKYRPANIDGQPDVETAALLEALTNPTGPLPQPLPAPVTTSPVFIPGVPQPALPPQPPVPPEPPESPVTPQPPVPAAPPVQDPLPAAPPVPVQQ